MSRNVLSKNMHHAVIDTRMWTHRGRFHTKLKPW